MPLQNRVLPDGSIVAVPQRGLLMGNRGGVFHDDRQQLRLKHWHSKQWICCLLAFKGRRRELMQPRRYTELFFLDEVTALAAGHRPCFECRRAAATDFAERWNAIRGVSGRAVAADMDQVLHAERVGANGAKRVHAMPASRLIDHVIVRSEGGFARVAGRKLQVWSMDGYGATSPLDLHRTYEVLTPPSTLAVLGAGYRPVLHTSAAS